MRTLTVRELRQLLFEVKNQDQKVVINITDDKDAGILGVWETWSLEKGNVLVLKINQ